MTAGSVLVVGLGDLGARIMFGLSRSRSFERLVGAGRSTERGEAIAAQAALTAELAGGPQQVEFRSLDLWNGDAVIHLLEDLRPDVVAFCASMHTWWRSSPNHAEHARHVRSLPYAVWLPAFLAPARAFMEAVRAANTQSRVVCLPYPDAVCPALGKLGLAPDVGAGNVTEVAAKLVRLAGRTRETPPDSLSLRLVMHHASERFAFGAFASLGGTVAGPVGEPPWRFDFRCGPLRFFDPEVSRLFHAPYPLLPGRESQELTAQAAVVTIEALLSESPVRLNVPGPLGLPGGYPVALSRDGVVADLEDFVSTDDAVATNEQAAGWDGLESIAEDGSIVFTDAAAHAGRDMIGQDLKRVSPDEWRDVAEEMVRRAASWF